MHAQVMLSGARFVGDSKVDESQLQPAPLYARTRRPRVNWFTALKAPMSTYMHRRRHPSFLENVEARSARLVSGIGRPQSADEVIS